MFVVLFLSSSVNCFSQSFLDENPDVKLIFFNNLKRLNLKYKCPKNYVEVFEPELARLGNHLLTGSYLKLYSQKDSILIYVAIMPIDTTSKTKNLTRKFNLNLIDANLEYLRKERDSLSNPLVFLSPKVLKNVYNADDGLSKNVPLSAGFRYKGVYSGCTVIIAHKANKADLHLYYFYTKNSQKKLKTHIRKNQPILSFE